MKIIGDILGAIVDAILGLIANLISLIAYGIELISYWITSAFIGVEPVRKIIEGLESTSSENMIKTQLSGVMESIALSLLAIFFIMELVSKSMSVHRITFEAVIVVLLKLVVAKMIVVNSWEILTVLRNVGMSFVADIGNATSAPAAPDYEASSGFIAALIRVIVAIIGLLSVIITVFVINIILLMRMVEIYIMTAVAPIAFATLANDSLKSAGKKFFLSYAAVCLQGGVILVVLFVGQVLMTQTTNNDPFSTNLSGAAGSAVTNVTNKITGTSDADKAGIKSNDLGGLQKSLASSISHGIAPIVMGLMVGKSKAMANSILGAG